MFKTLESSISVAVSTPVSTMPDGVQYGGVTSTVVFSAAFNILTKARLGLDNKGNVTFGNLEEGDAELVYQGTDRDFPAWCKLNAVATVDGIQYRMMDSRKKPRNFWHVAMKRVRGT